MNTPSQFLLRVPETDENTPLDRERSPPNLTSQTVREGEDSLGRTGRREGWAEAGRAGGGSPPGQGDTHAPAPRELLRGSILHLRVKAQAGQDPAGFGLCSGRPGGPQFLVHLGGGRRGHMLGGPGSPQS